MGGWGWGGLVGWHCTALAVCLLLCGQQELEGLGSVIAVHARYCVILQIAPA